MRYIQTPQCNDVLGAPRGATIEECGALPIMRAQYSNGQRVVVSFWQMDDQERSDFLAGKPIMLILWGDTMPPAALLVGDGI